MDNHEKDKEAGGRLAQARRAARLKPGDEAPSNTPGTGENLCPICHGTGRLNSTECANCEGTGRIIAGIGGG
jgi:hypothetical protein